MRLLFGLLVVQAGSLDGLQKTSGFNPKYIIAIMVVGFIRVFSFREQGLVFSVFKSG